MAKRQSTSNARAVGGGRAPVRPVRKTGSAAGAGRAPGKPRAPAADQRLASTRLAAMLDMHRGQLLRIESVVGCLHVALLHAGEREPKDDPNYAGTAGIALALVREAVDRLDAKFVDPLLRPLLSRKGGTVPTSPA